MKEEFYYNGSKKATYIKGIAIILLLIGIYAFAVCILDEDILGGITCLSSLISAVVLYALGEIIDLMHDIRENTEHLRDNIKEKN